MSTMKLGRMLLRLYFRRRSYCSTFNFGAFIYDVDVHIEKRTVKLIRGHLYFNLIDLQGHVCRHGSRNITGGNRGMCKG